MPEASIIRYIIVGGRKLSNGILVIASLMAVNVDFAASGNTNFRLAPRNMFVIGSNDVREIRDESMIEVNQVGEISQFSIRSKLSLVPNSSGFI